MSYNGKKLWAVCFVPFSGGSHDRLNHGLGDKILFLDGLGSKSKIADVFWASF